MGRLYRLLCKGINTERDGAGAPVYLAVDLKYFATEVLGLPRPLPQLSPASYCRQLQLPQKGAMLVLMPTSFAQEEREAGGTEALATT